MSVEVNFLMGIGFGVFTNKPKQLTILLGIIGIDMYWGD